MMISFPGTWIKNKKKRSSPRRNNGGYVLVDVVIALFIMGVAIVSILTGFAFAARMAGETLHQAKQIVLDRNEFEKLPMYPAEKP